MKIALVAPYFPPVIGGIETYIYELAKRLSKENEVYVFTCGRGVTERYNGVKVFRLRAIDIKNLPFPLKIPYPIPASLMFKLAKFDLDIIHAHGHAFMTSFQAALAARLAHKPFVLSIHDLGVAYQDHAVMRGVRPIVDSTIVRYVFKRADSVITQNEATYTYASRFKPRRVTIIPQGVDLNKFKPKEEGEYVTFIAARLVPQKGCETFIKAVPHVINELGETRFMVIGDGIQRSYLRKLADDLGVIDHIAFVGAVPYESVPEYLGQSKIVAFPSEIPTGLTLLEAAAMKRPIITTRNRWAVNSLGDTPLYVSMRNPEETAKAMICLLKNPRKRRKIAELTYRKVASERSWDKVTSKHMEIYNKLIGGHV